MDARGCWKVEKMCKYSNHPFALKHFVLCIKYQLFGMVYKAPRHVVSCQFHFSVIHTHHLLWQWWPYNSILISWSLMWCFCFLEWPRLSITSMKNWLTFFCCHEGCCVWLLRWDSSQLWGNHHSPEPWHGRCPLGCAGENLHSCASWPRTAFLSITLHSNGQSKCLPCFRSVGFMEAGTVSYQYT